MDVLASSNARFLGSNSPPSNDQFKRLAVLLRLFLFLLYLSSVALPLEKTEVDVLSRFESELLVRAAHRPDAAPICHAFFECGRHRCLLRFSQFLLHESLVEWNMLFRQLALLTHLFQ